MGCGQGCALQNRDDVFGFNAKPLVAGSSYQWYSQVEYSVSAGRKRSPAMGNNVQEVRVGEETDGVVIESSMVIGGLSAADFEQGRACAGRGRRARSGAEFDQDCERDRREFWKEEGEWRCRGRVHGQGFEIRRGCREKAG